MLAVRNGSAPTAAAQASSNIGAALLRQTVARLLRRGISCRVVVEATRSRKEIVDTLLAAVDPAACDLALGLTIRPPDVAEVSNLAGIPELSIHVVESPSEELADQTPGDIVLTRLLAEGGMGRVYLAEQRSIGREVVVKTARDPGSDKQARALLSEGAHTGNVEHPNVPPVHMLGRAPDGQPVLVMKRIVGVSWSALLDDPNHAGWRAFMATDASGRLRANLTILMQVAAALHHAHGCEIVHRDVKPQNVMIGEGGEVYLVDWGIAAYVGHCEHGLVGTPSFVAPEMLQQQPIGPYTDVYLLGATLHVLLTGKARHRGKDLNEVLFAAIESEPFAYGPDTPAELAELANQSTSFEIGARPPSANVFRTKLAEFLAHRGAFLLIQVAEERVAQLAELRASEKRLDDPRLLRLANEARFGFEQALAQHPGSTRAKAGLQTLVREQLALEIDRGNVAAARALSQELADVPAELAEQLSALETLVARRESERERLEKLDREMDLKPVRRVVGITSAVLAVVAVITQVTIGSVYGSTVDARTALLMGIGFFGVVATGLVLTWKHSAHNEMAKRVSLLLLGCVAMMPLNRLFGWLADVDGETLLRHDLLTFAMGAMAVGIFGPRRWLVSAGVFVVGASASATWPGHIVLVFGASTVIALAAMTLELKWPT